MALPLKTGADLYNQQLIRARLQNLGAQPNTADVGLGQVYFNTGTNTAASLRIGYCYETGSVPKFHHVANLEDVNRLEELISALSGSSSESVASVLGRVITLEGYFSNGKAKDADLLDGHNSDYFATATSLGELLEDYEAFKAVFSDNSDEYINTWSEVKAFLDGIKNTEDLNAILLGINTELGKKADKATTLAGYGITDGIKYVNGIDLANGVPHNEAGYGYNQYGWKANGPALSIGTDGYLMLLQVSTSDGQLYRRYIGGDYKGAWYKILDDNNYASVLDTRYLQLTGGELSGGLTIKNNSGLYFKDTLGKAILALYVNSANKLILGAGANAEGYSTYIEGKNVYVNNNIALHGGNYSDLITTLNGNLSVGGNISLQNTGQLRYDNKEVIQYVASNNSLYIGYGTAGSSEAWNTSVWGNNIKLINKSGATLLHAKDSNDVTIGYLDALSILSNQDVHIKGNLIVDGEVSSGGIGSEGSGGASGIVILEDWEKYDDTLAQALGAGLGLDLRDKVSSLESKATNVSVAQTLTSGKEIGAITIDGVATKLYAPATYAWGEITSKPTTLAGYGITDAVALQGKRNDLLHGGNEFSFVSEGFSGEVWLNYRTLNAADGNITLYNFGAGSGFNFSWLRSSGYIVYGGTSSQFLKADGSLDSNAYLPLSGGVIKGSLEKRLPTEGATQNYILFTRHNGTAQGHLGFNGVDNPIYIPSAANAIYSLLHEGNYESIVGNKFLKLSGGEITGSLIVGRTDSSAPLCVTSSFTPYTAMAFRGSTLKYAYLIYSGTGDTWEVTNEGWGRTSVLLHANNFNSYAPTLTGTGANGTWGIDITGAAMALKPTLTRPSTANVEPIGDGSVRSFLVTSAMTEGKPHEGAAGTILSFYWDAVSKYTRQLFIGAEDAIDSPNRRLAWRTQDGHRWSAWKTVAFTDSDITGNAASATKLANNHAYTAWGQPFFADGVPQEIGYAKDIKIGANNGVAWIMSDGAEVSNIVTGATGNFLLGNGGAKKGYNTFLDGNYVYLRYGTWHETGLMLNSSGNVTIGDRDLAGANYKLYINGSTKIAGTIYDVNNIYPNSAGERYIGTSTNPFKYVYAEWYGAGIGQALSFGANNAVHMLINSSGNVTIGASDLAKTDHKLWVNGSVNVRGAIYVYEGMTNSLYRDTSVEFGARTAGFAHGIYQKNSQDAALAGIGFHGSADTLYYIFLGEEYDKPWLRISSTVARFNSRLLVNGATDDRTTALQVNGDIALRRGVSSTIGAPYDANNPTIYNRIIFDGATYGIRYYSGGWTSSVVDSHTFYVGLNNDAALIIKNNKDVHISGNLIVDGQVSSGGVAEAGTGGAGGGSALDRVPFTIPVNTTSFTCEHNLGTREISVSIYEDGNDFQQVLADVYLDSTNVARIVFGSATDVVHKVVIIG